MEEKWVFLYVSFYGHQFGPPQKNVSGANALAHQHVLRFIVLEVKMPFRCFPKAKAIQSCVRKQNNCPSFGNISTSSCIPTEQASFVLIYLASMKHRL